MPFTKAELAQVASIVRLGVASKQLPEFLFKYRPLNEFFDSLLETNQMWFSSPKEFNDPFDCKAKIDSRNSADEIKLYAEKNFQFTSRLQKRQTIANWTKNPSAFHKL